MHSVIFACISKINQTGCFLGFCVQMRKIDKIGTKRRKFGKFWWKSPKKLRKKNPNVINTQYLIIAKQGFFLINIINAWYLISTSGLDFGPKKLSVHCTIVQSKNCTFALEMDDTQQEIFLLSLPMYYKHFPLGLRVPMVEGMGGDRFDTQHRILQ